MTFLKSLPRKLASKNYRRGRDMAGQVRKLLKHQRDILTDGNLAALDSSLVSFTEILEDPARDAEIPAAMNSMEQAANENFRHYPNPIARENVEVFLVAIAVALSVRSFFIQPYKIPTGSMQPTLWGNEEFNLIGTNEEVPGFFGKLAAFCFKGTSYYELESKVDGKLESISPVKTVVPFILKKRNFVIDGVTHTMWNPPPVINNSGRPPTDYLVQSGGLRQYDEFKKGDPVVRFKFVRGDFLFVDRLTYNFRPPKRGEIIVFKTEGIKEIPGAGQFYIKRLVGLPDEKLRIGDDRHIYINGNRLDKTTPGFEGVYSFDPNVPPRDSRFSGHVNSWTYRNSIPGLGGLGGLPYHKFLNETAEYQISPNHVMAMGDNTMNSSDSRSWGEFPMSNIVGKFAFTFWPFIRDEIPDSKSHH